MMKFLLENYQSWVPTRFVLGVTEVLCSEGLPIWVFWVWRQSGVQVRAEHMHDDLEIQNIIYTVYGLYFLKHLQPKDPKFKHFSNLKNTLKHSVMFEAFCK